LNGASSDSAWCNSSFSYQLSAESRQLLRREAVKHGFLEMKLKAKS